MMNDMFSCLLSEIIQFANGDLKKGCVSFTLPNEQRKLRKDYNSTCTEVIPQMLFSGFLNNVRKRPNNIAIVDKDRLITYRDLHNAVAVIVNLMEEKGVTPEQRIGIYSHKGWEQIVAALAIQIVGCAYVAIDPNLPAIRQEFILNDSNISL